MAKGVQQTGKFTYDSVEYGITDLRFTVQEDEIDVTDTASAAGEREFLSTGRKNREFSVSLYKDVNSANLTTGVSTVAELDFAGFTYGGNVILTGYEEGATVDGAVEQTYNGRFTGAVTETPAP